MDGGEEDVHEVLHHLRLRLKVLVVRMALALATTVDLFAIVAGLEYSVAVQSVFRDVRIAGAHQHNPQLITEFTYVGECDDVSATDLVELLLLEKDELIQFTHSITLVAWGKGIQTKQRVCSQVTEALPYRKQQRKSKSDNIRLRNSR